MTEKQKHLELKKKGKELLLNQGFKESEIFFEYRLILNKNKWLLIDVAGINNEKTAFIECGNINGENRFEILKSYCDNVIYLKYPKEKREGTPMNFFIEPELHKSFKIKSIDIGKDMRDILVDFIKEFVKNK